MQRIMPLVATLDGKHDVPRWSRIAAEWSRRRELVDGQGRRWTTLQAGESIEADVMAGRL